MAAFIYIYIYIFLLLAGDEILTWDVMHDCVIFHYIC